MHTRLFVTCALHCLGTNMPNFVRWMSQPNIPPRWLIILGGWLGLNKRVYDLERRIAELERKLWQK